MLRKKTITRLFLALWLVLSFASCASDTASDVPQNQSKAYLQVQVHVAGSGGTSQSRADAEQKGPNGGEDGDGREDGADNENKVNNITLLLYTPSINDESSKIEEAMYFSQMKYDDVKKAWISNTKKVESILVTKNYQILVVVNEGDLSSWKGKNMSEIKDHVISKVCSRSDKIADFSDFVMSSDKETNLVSKSGTGSETDPYLIETEVERLAARIDIVPNADLSSDRAYYYNVKDASDNIIGGFKLESVVPTKVLTSGEYLIKRVSDDASLSTLTYFGKEQMDASNKSTNYVVCPQTAVATGATPTARDNAEGTDAFYKVREAGRADATSTSSDNYFILDYVMENTTTDNAEAYSTGLLFKGTYYEKSQWNSTDCKPNDGATGEPKEYTYTIRHSDPSGSGTLSDPMHYGIVRNNIYRIKIDGVEGKEPDGLKLTINVVPWARYEHEEVIY